MKTPEELKQMNSILTNMRDNRNDKAYLYGVTPQDVIDNLDLSIGYKDVELMLIKMESDGYLINYQPHLKSPPIHYTISIDGIMFISSNGYRLPKMPNWFKRTQSFWLVILGGALTIGGTYWLNMSKQEQPHTHKEFETFQNDYCILHKDSLE
jgi:hypothetical protein